MSQPDLIAQLRAGTADRAGRAARARPADRGRRRAEPPRRRAHLAARARRRRAARRRRRRRGAPAARAGTHSRADSRDPASRTLSRPANPVAARLRTASHRSARPASRHRRRRRADRRTGGTVPAPSPDRVQRISTSLELRVPNTQAVSDATKQAVAIARALGGYPSSLNVAAGRAHGLRRHRPAHPEAARPAGRRAPLGARDDHRRERLDQGHPGQVDATARKIARLEARLADWQAAAADDRGPEARRRAHGADRAS